MNITTILILITVVASIYAWNNQDIYRKWIMNPYVVQRQKQYYRFVTSGFIHADWMHLIFNMWALYLFGDNLEFYLSKISPGLYEITYIGLYLSAIVVSEIPTFFKFKNYSGYQSLGASGAVSTVIFASIMIAPKETIYFFLIPMWGFVFGILYLIYSYLLSKKNMDGINHDAHFYGAVYGIVSIIVLYPPVVSSFFEQISNLSVF